MISSSHKTLTIPPRFTKPSFRKIEAANRKQVGFMIQKLSILVVGIRFAAVGRRGCLVLTRWYLKKPFNLQDRWRYLDHFLFWGDTDFSPGKTRAQYSLLILRYLYKGNRRTGFSRSISHIKPPKLPSQGGAFGILQALQSSWVTFPSDPISVTHGKSSRDGWCLKLNTWRNTRMNNKNNIHDNPFISVYASWSDTLKLTILIRGFIEVWCRHSHWMEGP